MQTTITHFRLVCLSVWLAVNHVDAFLLGSSFSDMSSLYLGLTLTPAFFWSYSLLCLRYREPQDFNMAEHSKCLLCHELAQQFCIVLASWLWKHVSQAVMLSCYLVLISANPMQHILTKWPRAHHSKDIWDHNEFHTLLTFTFLLQNQNTCQTFPVFFFFIFPLGLVVY